MTDERAGATGRDTGVAPARDAVAEELRAEFGMWLVGQRVPAMQRRWVRRQVERFAVWRTGRDYVSATERAAARCYLTRLRGEGVSDTELLQAWAALELFLEYAEPDYGARTTNEPPVRVPAPRSAADCR